MATIAIKSIEAAIASGQSLSGVIALGADVLHGIQMPAGWDAAALTFQVSIDGGANFSELVSSAGAAISYTVAAGSYIVIDPALWRAINCLKIRSGTSGAAVNQTADRAFKLIVRPAT